MCPGFLRVLLVSLGLATAIVQPTPAIGAPPMLGGSLEEKRTIGVNNRILAKIHGKVISVLDVQKKLDVLFYRRFPEYASAPSMRYQFYMINWRPILNDLIDKELILADATESKIEITKGDVRQEMETLFGPNIIVNLDKVGLSFEEAREMIEGDLIIRRMMMLRVNVKAHSSVGPGDIRKAYLKYIETHNKPTEWVYQVITVRHPNPEKGLASANILRNVLAGKQTTIDELASNYQLIEAIDPETKVTFSEEFKQTEKEISDAYKEILAGMTSDSYSQPIEQQSRAKNSTVHRIFYVKVLIPGGTIPLAEVETELHGQLLSEAIAKENEVYLNRLRKQAGLTKEKLAQMVPTDFEPFILK